MESNEPAAPIDLSYLCVSPQFPFNDNDVLAEWAKHEAGLPASSSSAPSTTRPSTSSPSDSSPPNGASTLSPAQRRKHAHSEVEKERRRSITNGFTALQAVLNPGDVKTMPKSVILEQACHAIEDLRAKLDTNEKLLAAKADQSPLSRRPSASWSVDGAAEERSVVDMPPQSRPRQTGQADAWRALTSIGTTTRHLGHTVPCRCPGPSQMDAWHAPFSEECHRRQSWSAPSSPPPPPRPQGTEDLQHALASLVRYVAAQDPQARKPRPMDGFQGGADSESESGISPTEAPPTTKGRLVDQQSLAWSLGNGQHVRWGDMAGLPGAHTVTARGTKRTALGEQLPGTATQRVRTSPWETRTSVE